MSSSYGCVMKREREASFGLVPVARCRRGGQPLATPSSLWCQFCPRCYWTFQGPLKGVILCLGLEVASRPLAGPPQFYVPFFLLVNDSFSRAQVPLSFKSRYVLFLPPVVFLASSSTFTLNLLSGLRSYLLLAFNRKQVSYMSVIYLYYLFTHVSYL